MLSLVECAAVDEYFTPGPLVLYTQTVAGKVGVRERERERGNENKKTTERRKRSECGRDDEYPICSQAHR